MHKYLFILIFLYFSQSLFATKCTTQADGIWANNLTWGCLIVPAAPLNCYDSIVINHNVTITNQRDLEACGPITLIINDTLFFVPGNKLRLPCGSKVILNGWIIPTGGGGSSNLLTICGNTVWKTSDGPIGGGVVLDISLLSFTGKLNSSHVELNWQTASEINNSHFIVEKSINGYDFEFLTQVNGAGNSSITLSYSSKDENPEIGINYYRLKSVDFNSVVKNEGIVTINYNDFDFNFYPNPFRDKINITVNNSYEFLTLKVCNILGEFVSELKLSGGDTYQISKEELGITAKGSYFLVLYPNSNYHLASKKIINH